MALTIGTGLLGARPAGVFNAELAMPKHLLYFEPVEKRVRAVLAGETIADSTGVKMLHESGHLPVYYFPEADVRKDLFERTAHSTHCPVKGDAAYWTIAVDARRAENAVWSYPEPVSSAPWLAGHLAFDWEAVDAWFEEDEQVFVHPRDPYTRIDVLPSSRQVRVRIDGTLVAESNRPRLLFETGLPVRYYLPREDVRSEMLEPTDKVTQCPYKGEAQYWSVRTDHGVFCDVVWSYADPFHDAQTVRGMLCFSDEHADLEVDGTQLDRPQTPFS